MAAELDKILLAGLLAFIAAAAPAGAEDPLTPPRLPGIGAHDPRVRTNPDAGPWRAVGKLQATSGGLHESCTGTLIGPATVLTAAHCVFNVRTQHNFRADSLHFLIGYNGDDYAGHAIGVRLVTGPGYDPLRPDRTRGSDWALLTLAARLGTPDRVLALADGPPPVGAKIMIGGYSQDHPLVLMDDPDCRIVGRAADGGGRPLLVDDCAATRGVSGAPALVADGKGWRVGGIYVAAAAKAQLGIVVPLADVQAALERSRGGQGANR
jgi:protease YdgD